MEEKKKTSRKKKETITPSTPNVEELEKIVTEEVQQEVDKMKIDSCFTTEEKLYITKLIANGYRPFDVVKKVRYKLKLSEEKMKKLSLNIRTVEQLIKALES